MRAQAGGGWIVVGLVVGLVACLVACSRPAAEPKEDHARRSPPEPAAPAEPDARPVSTDARAPAPAAELQTLQRCAEHEVPPFYSTAVRAPEGAPEPFECERLLIERCGLKPEPTWDPNEGIVMGLSERTRRWVGACTGRYCERWSAFARPVLCDEPAEAFLDTPDLAQATTKAETFIAAMLALDYGRPRDDAAIQQVAAYVARAWAKPVAVHTVPPGTPTLEDDPLKLRVAVTLTTLTVSGEGLPATELPTADLDAVQRYARALQARYPAARTVVLEVANDVPMQTMINVMDTLNGGGFTAPIVEMKE